MKDPSCGYPHQNHQPSFPERISPFQCVLQVAVELQQVQDVHWVLVAALKEVAV
jgi:hypothetical protein